ncbi:LytR C-terminal domain-containing protein [Streptomyces sp. N2-109]|uniref:LytR C-terminal domain-containing protein n=1 Tax=Streptomyces gossypii TaxID=2883101 RepID=A0ABT2JNV0_9ACTN|nr:LytR C-terminal domain-containing protein [Streptomyces gossypii]MCT2589398.1 LytR C-terminal domain-containing protein [Streptomyces gossypii]
MSMLTPPGMGGQYRIKGDRHPRMRRPRNRRKIVLAGVAAVTALGLTGWGTLQLIDVFSGDDGSTAQAADRTDDKCAPADSEPAGKSTDGKSATGKRPSGRTGALPKPGAITVNVLNATAKSGLAADTADELKKRGFKVGEVANAPGSLDGKVKATGLLVGATGAKTIDRLKVLGFHLKGAETRYDHRKGADVDLVIGKNFKKLTAEKDATRALTALVSPAPKPSGGC